MIAYKLQNEDLPSLKSTADLLNFVMHKKHFSTDYLKWEYLENPIGKAIAYNAFDNGTLIGHYGAQPIISSIDGIDREGIFILNAAVLPEYQGMGILRILVEKLHENAVKNNFEFIIGVGNKNSGPIYTKKFGFRSLGPLDVKLGLGLPQATLDSEVLYERIWSEDCLNWRLSNPCTKYLSTCRNNRRVFYKSNYPALSTIMGIFNCSINDPGSSVKPKMPGFNIFLGRDPAIDWGENKFYVSFPETFKPSPLILIFKELKKDSYKFTDKQLKFRCLDFDAF